MSFLFSFNQNIENLKPSKSMTFMVKARKLQAADPDVINLSGGEPDFDTPVRIREEAKRWLDKGYTHYTIGPGLPELREGIAQKLQEENGCHYSPDEVIVTPGGKYAIYLSVRSVVNAGDEVMYLEPGWVSYPSIIEASGAVPVPVRLSFADNFRLTAEKLEAFVTPKTKLLIINYPNNPTGRTLNRQEADVVEAFMLKHPDILLLSDEMYERIVFTGYENISPASYASIADRVITVNGFSKSVAMTGWRIGYLAAPKAVRDVVYKIYQHTISCVSGFIMKAAAVALECREEIEEMRKSYEHRRDLFIGALNAIDGVEATYPEGAFYAWVKFDVPGMDSEAVCELVLNQAKVVGVPGGAYGTDECCLRFSFATEESELMKAAARIKTLMESVRKQGVHNG